MKKFKKKKDISRIEGVVVECLSNNKFRVKIDKRVILCYLCGNMLKNSIKVLLDDKVLIELNRVDLNLGRIVFRL